MGAENQNSDMNKRIANFVSWALTFGIASMFYVMGQIWMIVNTNQIAVKALETKVEAHEKLPAHFEQMQKNDLMQSKLDKITGNINNHHQETLRRLSNGSR